MPPSSTSQELSQHPPARRRPIALWVLAAATAFVLVACSDSQPTVTMPTVTLGPPTTVTIPPETIAPVSTTVPEEVEGLRVGLGDDLAAMVEAAEPGTRFVISAGTHRVDTIRPKDGMQFVGEPGAVISGAQLVSGFVTDGEVWRLDGIEMTGETRGTCLNILPGCQFSQDLFMDDVMMRQVISLEELTSGRWFWDGDSIFVADDPSTRRVELSVTPYAFLGGAADVEISDLTVEKFATPAQEAAVHAQELGDGERGQRWVIRDVLITLNHAVGIRTGDETLVTGAVVSYNGQMGISVSGGTDVIIENSELANNNIAGFDWTWEAGGLKATRTSGLIVRNNYSHNNLGPGLWTDIDAMDTLYEGNRVVDNAASGIFHEISGPAIIRNNVVEGNGFGKPEWLWGAGILIAASNDVEVYGNTVLGNADGIAGIQQDRQDGPRAPYLLENVDIYDNTITMSQGQTGVVTDTGSDAVFTSRNLSFYENTYLDTNGRRFAWEGRSLDQSGWQDAGQGIGSSWQES